MWSLLPMLMLCAMPPHVSAASPGTTPLPALPDSLRQCFDRHAARFGLDSGLLQSVARVESGMQPGVDNNDHEARTGSRDIGLMQINTVWLPTLRQYGIGLKELRDPCTNIEVGAWILSDLVQRYGNSWTAVGAYNAACTELKGADCTRARGSYAWKVWRQRQRVAFALQEGGSAGSDPAQARPAPKAPGLVAMSALSAKSIEPSTGPAGPAGPAGPEQGAQP